MVRQRRVRVEEPGHLLAAPRRGEWLIEPFTEGSAVTCGVLQRDGTLMTLPPLQTVPTTAEFYDYAAKRNPGGHRYRCPAAIPEAALAEISQNTLEAHRALRCSGYSRSDFLVTPDGEVFWLEANTLPGLSRHGNLATAASAAGISEPGRSSSAAPTTPSPRSARPAASAA